MVTLRETAHPPGTQAQTGALAPFVARTPLPCAIAFAVARMSMVEAWLGIASWRMAARTYVETCTRTSTRARAGMAGRANRPCSLGVWLV